MEVTLKNYWSYSAHKAYTNRTTSPPGNNLPSLLQSSKVKIQSLTTWQVNRHTSFSVYSLLSASKYCSSLLLLLRQPLLLTPFQPNIQYVPCSPAVTVISGRKTGQKMKSSTVVWVHSWIAAITPFLLVLYFTSTLFPTVIFISGLKTVAGEWVLINR